MLIKQAISHFTSPMDPDEIAGLSLEEESCARLVSETPSKNQWQLKHGPFTETDFSSLPTSHWTLLVQHADALDPRVNALLNYFRFIPNWRLDDIMVSYASDNGGVGPHFDYYDVFLLQGSGKRRWRIGQQCDSQSPLVPEQEMKILQNFQCTEDWLVDTGDLIYIPARTAHWGEAIEHSITYSIGFRAPSLSETLLDFSESVTATLSEDQRYQDPENALPQTHRGQISESTIQQLQENILELANNKNALIAWFGSYTTELKADLNPALVEQNFASLSDWHNNKPLFLSPFCRASYHVTEDSATCFINGEVFYSNHKLAQRLCHEESIEKNTLSASDAIIIESLINRQWMIIRD